jgi:hypothetical protein
MRLRLALAAVAVLALAVPSVAEAKPRPAPAPTASGYDVSYPQCGGALPSGAQFGIVGVDGGRVRSANPCLATEDAWARAASAAPAYYLNTGNPGPRVSNFWPSGQASPRACATTYPANDSADCAYDYGWNNAQDSWARAASAGVPTPELRTWWLDVETGNSWETLQYGQAATYQANDLATLQGQRDFLRSQGVQTVGVYSTAYQWGQVVGSSAFDAAPAWYAGTGSLSTAQSHCGAAAFTGGVVTLVQFANAGYDGDVRCPGV